MRLCLLAHYTFYAHNNRVWIGRVYGFLFEAISLWQSFIDSFCLSFHPVLGEFIWRV